MSKNELFASVGAPETKETIGVLFPMKFNAVNSHLTTVEDGTPHDFLNGQYLSSKNSFLFPL